jgi:hypothetical protein
MRSSPRRRRRSISRAWRSRSSPQRRRVVAVEEQRALDERGEAAVAMPACWAPAGVGHTVRTSAAASAARSAAAARGPPRVSRAGSTPASSLVFSGARMRSRQSEPSMSASSAGASASRWTSRAAAQ